MQAQCEERAGPQRNLTGRHQETGPLRDPSRGSVIPLQGTENQRLLFIIFEIKLLLDCPWPVCYGLESMGSLDLKLK